MLTSSISYRPFLMVKFRSQQIPDFDLSYIVHNKLIILQTTARSRVRLPWPHRNNYSVF